MDYVGSSHLVVMIADWKLPMGVHTMQVSGQHVYHSMPKLTSPWEAATQMTTSITDKLTTYFLLRGTYRVSMSVRIVKAGCHPVAIAQVVEHWQLKLVQSWMAAGSSQFSKIYLSLFHHVQCTCTYYCNTELEIVCLTEEGFLCYCKDSACPAGLLSSSVGRASSVQYVAGLSPTWSSCLRA